MLVSGCLVPASSPLSLQDAGSSRRSRMWQTRRPWLLRGAADVF
jgi:hypothetical protein